MIWENGNGFVIRLEPAGERRGSGRRVRDQATRRSRARRADMVLVQNEDVVHRQALGYLSIIPRHCETGGTHAVGDHEDHVAFTGRFTAGSPGRLFARVVLGHLMLIEDSEDDDDSGRYDRPGENADFSPETPASGLGPVGTLAR